MGKFKVSSGQAFLFVGDSITDCGRRDQCAPLGNGYVRQTVDLVTARYPERKIRFINEGIGGNTVRDLQARWTDDVLFHSPDWLSVKIGINDLHQHLGGGQGLGPSDYEKAYRDILTRARNRSNPRMILIDPFYMSADHGRADGRGAVLKLIPDYIKAVHKLAKEFGALLVKTHDLFQTQLKHRPADMFCGEPVHPNLKGHLVIAHGVLKELGW